MTQRRIHTTWHPTADALRKGLSLRFLVKQIKPSSHQAVSNGWEHTDYNGGHVFPAAISLGPHVSVTKYCVFTQLTLRIKESLSASS